MKRNLFFELFLITLIFSSCCRYGAINHHAVDGKKNLASAGNENGYVRFDEKLYTDKTGKLYIQTVRMDKDYNFEEYFREVTDLIDRQTYSVIKGDFFRNKGKVYLWNMTSDGEYPAEWPDADPETFVPFDAILGGKDKNAVFYDFEIVKGLDAKTAEILNPEGMPQNGGHCYFKDRKSVYHGVNKMEGADPESFTLLRSDNADAEDKHGKYLEGKRIN